MYEWGTCKKTPTKGYAYLYWAQHNWLASNRSLRDTSTRLIPEGSSVPTFCPITENPTRKQ